MQPGKPLESAHDLSTASAAEVRAAVRAGRWTGPTAGLARGYVQTNVVILPAADAGGVHGAKSRQRVGSCAAPILDDRLVKSREV